MKKRLLIIFLSITILTGLFYTIKKDDQSTIDNSTSNFQTVIFKDSQDMLIPVSIDFKIESEPDINYRNLIDVMKSNDYQYLGLYPVLDSQLQVNAISINDSSLTFDLSDHLYVNNNQEALDILELFAYVFCQDDFDSINLKINGNDLYELPNSTIPTTCLNRNLGINNFETTTNYLYKTTPVVVYNPKTINNQVYYVPVTKRIETTDSDLDTKVSLLLEEIESDINLHLTDGCSLQDGILSIHLAANILNDNESIDNILYHQIVKSAKHLENVESINIYVDNQEIAPVEDVNGIVENRIKL